MERVRAMLELIGHLYDATTEPVKWEVFLAAAAEFFVASAGQLVHHSEQYPETSITLFYGPRLPANIYQLAKRNLQLAGEDPRMQYGVRYPGKPMSCRLVIDEHDLHASRPYKEVLRPAGIEYTLGVQIADDPGTLTGIALFREPGSVPFTNEDCDWLGQLVPHLRRAFAIQKHFGTIDLRQRSSYRLLDGVPIGILLCDSGGVVEYQNEAARAILSADDGVTVRSGRLSLWNSGDREALLEAMRAASLPGNARPVALLIRRPSGATPLQCVVSRLWPSEVFSPFHLIELPLIVIYLSDPDRALETPQELLQRLFGLTRQEAAVTERLTAGCTLEVIATELGVSLETVRSHLKAVFSKTNTNRQTDLVRLVMASPLWMRLNAAVPMVRAAGEQTG